MSAADLAHDDDDDDDDLPSTNYDKFHGMFLFFFMKVESREHIFAGE